MEIILDNIIFSLQKSGGISVVWQKHLERLLVDHEFKCRILEYDNSEMNFFRQQLLINSELIDSKSSKLLSFKRYLNLNEKNIDKHLFHSSYYRIQNGKNAVNVTTVHDFTYEYFTKGLLQKVHSWQKNFAIQNSDGIICISQSTKKDLLKFLPHIPNNKIRVIYNGVDEGFKILKDHKCLEKKHIFEDFSYAMYVGDRNAAYKNFDMAVEACSFAKIPLLIIGGGELSTKEFQKLETKLGQGNFFNIFKASVEDLNFYYNKALCLLYPSLYEGFGLPVVEAQSAGCPVIATSSSSIPEVIGNQYLAIDNPTSDKIARKIKELSMNSLRRETLEMGIEKSKKFSWENTYKLTKEFYQDLYIS